MKIIIQRVLKAKVTSEEKLVSTINKGYIILICFKRDYIPDLNSVIKKILKLRLFDNWKKTITDNKNMKDMICKNALSLDQCKEILLLSQFTLYASTKNVKPSFHMAEETEKAKKLFYEFVEEFKKQFKNVKSGIFGKYLNIETTLDGPCTITIEF